MELTREMIIEEFRKFYNENNRSPKGSDKFYFTRKMVVYRFGTWNEALNCAGLPWNVTPPAMVKCLTCNKMFLKHLTQLKKSANDFCSHRCSAIHRNINYKMPESVRNKIRNTINSKYDFTRQCIVCKKTYVHRRRKTCSNDCYRTTKTHAFRLKSLN